MQKDLEQPVKSEEVKIPKKTTKIQEEKEVTNNELFYKLQQSVKKIGFDANNAHFKFDYVTLGKLLITLHPYMEKLKLAYSQPIKIKDGKNVLETVIFRIDKDGPESVIAQSEAILVSRSESNPQDFGGAVTYQRRYQLFSLLGIVGDKDDDCQLENSEILKRLNACRTQQEIIALYKSIPQDQFEELKEEFSARKNEIQQEILANAQRKESV